MCNRKNQAKQEIAFSFAFLAHAPGSFVLEGQQLSNNDLRQFIQSYSIRQYRVIHSRVSTSWLLGLSVCHYETEGYAYTDAKHPISENGTQDWPW